MTSAHAPTRVRDETDPLSEEGEYEDEVNQEEENGAAVDNDGEGGDNEEDREEDPITLKDRQSLINVEHPFGLPIWKPALYKKSRSVTRYADQALHSIPSAQAERHLLPGNIFWVLIFGWWLSAACVAVSVVLYIVPLGGRRYASLVYGLGWYIAWPFGKYVEGDVGDKAYKDDEESARHLNADDEDDDEDDDDENFAPSPVAEESDPEADYEVNPSRSSPSTITPRSTLPQEPSADSWEAPPTARTSLLKRKARAPLTPSKSYGATLSTSGSPFLSYETGDVAQDASGAWLGWAVYWLLFISIIAPLMLIVCILCWAFVFTIPMAKLTWALLTHLIERPTSIRFCAAPLVAVPSDDNLAAHSQNADAPTEPPIAYKSARLSAGQAAPSGSPTSRVLLCTYRAVGWQYYKYTVGGVNILFINLLPLVFFVILDGFVLEPLVEHRKEAGKHVPAILLFLTSRVVIFILSLASVIPLSYFIGMAVASISAQSSIGMGAVINATFGSIIEIILYGMALTQGKGHLVEGSIVGSLLAGVLLMPGMSMCSGALRRKEQVFNAKSAGVTSMLLIMAFVGTLTPTLFYQTYGSVSSTLVLVDLCINCTYRSSSLFATGARNQLLVLKHLICRGNVNIVTISTQTQSMILSTNRQ